MSITCKTLYNVAQVDKVWEIRAQQDFDVLLCQRNNSRNHSSKDFYKVSNLAIINLTKNWGFESAFSCRCVFSTFLTLHLQNLIFLKLSSCLQQQHLVWNTYYTSKFECDLSICKLWLIFIKLAFWNLCKIIFYEAQFSF